MTTSESRSAKPAPPTEPDEAPTNAADPTDTPPAGEAGDTSGADPETGAMPSPSAQPGAPDVRGASEESTKGGDAGGAGTPAGAGSARSSTPLSPGGPRDRRPEGPRRVRHGIKLRARDEALEDSALSTAVLQRLRSRIDGDELAEGLRYARLGQAVSFEVAPGGAVASVQDRGPRPFEVEIAMDRFSSPAWEGIVEAMATEAVYLVKLMADELPEGTAPLLARFGLTLLPDAADLRLTCSCPAEAPCRHLAVAGFLLAERLVSSPGAILTLRGMPVPELLERLRQMRAVCARGVAAAHGEPAVAEARAAAIPLEACVDDFWRPGPGLADLHTSPPSRHVTHALLRRLGPSPLGGRFPLVGLLASIYDTVAERALALRDRVERLDASPSEGEADEDESEDDD